MMQMNPVKKIANKLRRLVSHSRPGGAVKSVAYRNKHAKKYIREKEYRAKIALYIALVMNMLFAAVKLTGGIYYESFWYGADAFFYIVLSTANFAILRYLRKDDTDKEPEHEYKLYRLCGIFLLFLVVALASLVYQIVYQNKWFEYPNTIILSVATYTFGCLVTAIFNVFSYRKLGSPALTAAKAIRLARALVAIFALQTALLHTFADESFAPYRALSNALTGGGVCLLIFVMGLFMIRSAEKNLKKLRCTE